MLHSASDKAKLFTKNFSRNSNIDDSRYLFTCFPSTTYLKQHNNPSNTELVKKVINNLDCQKRKVLIEFLWWFSGKVSLNLHTYHPTSYICVWRNLVFQTVGRSHLWLLYLPVLVRGLMQKNYHLVSHLSVVSKVFEKLVNNRLVDHLQKCDLFLISNIWLQVFSINWRASDSLSDRIPRAFNRSGPTEAVALDISQIFDRV